MQRNRIAYGIAAGTVIILGLASRKYSYALLPFIARYGGDTLWAVMAFLGFGILFPRWPILRVAVTALLFAFAIELSQLYHSPALDQIRRTTPGSLVLGNGFLWSDLLCYTVGVLIGCAVEMFVARSNCRSAE